ncbi:unnamed protein product [Eruca vesicaria subsp. sativa]|uniref:Replication factor A C-terminal domain-containing protein n=1 Tax=Eruca vesicaria subsp. sativa TaxID=29727 RepID=A0ABC8JRP9_ERUVS|nr:unnamed protein product [Eruca vesicaria subsp. sativa]
MLIVCIYVHSLIIRGTGLLAPAPLLTHATNVEPLTIAKVNKFAIIALAEEIEFMITGRITGVDVHKGWCYVGCRKCSRELHLTVPGFACVRCNKPHADGDLCYRVTLGIADDTAEGVFIFFDGVMTKLLSLEARDVDQMLVEKYENPEDSPVPPLIKYIEGKTYSFHVRLTSYDFTARRQPFTITHIICEEECTHLNGVNDIEAGNSIPLKPETVRISGVSIK